MDVGDKRDELIELLKKDGHGEKTTDDNMDELIKLLTKLDQINWIVSFKDFDSLNIMKIFLIYPMYMSSTLANENKSTFVKLLKTDFLKLKNDRNVIDAFAELENMPTSYYEDLANAYIKFGKYHQLWLIFKNESVPEDIVIKIAEKLDEDDSDQHYEMIYLTGRKNMSEKLMNFLLSRKDDFFTKAILDKAPLPIEVFEKYLNETNDHLLKMNINSISKNDNAPEKIRWKVYELAEKMDEINPLYRLAERANISEKMANDLFAKNNFGLDECLATNKDVNDSIKQKLVERYAEQKYRLRKIRYAIKNHNVMR